MSPNTKSQYAEVGQKLLFSIDENGIPVAHKEDVSPDHSIVHLRSGDVLALTVPALIQNSFGMAGVVKAVFVKNDGSESENKPDQLKFPDKNKSHIFN